MTPLIEDVLWFRMGLKDPFTGEYGFDFDRAADLANTMGYACICWNGKIWEMVDGRWLPSSEYEFNINKIPLKNVQDGPYLR